MNIVKYVMKFSGVRTATAGIIEKNGKVLLTKRSKMIAEGGKWCLPGGHVKKWETAEDCVKRELKEEVGLDVEKAKLLFVHEEFKKDLNLNWMDCIGKVFCNRSRGHIWQIARKNRQICQIWTPVLP